MPWNKQAKAALDRLSADELAQIRAEHREMAELTFEAALAAAREEAEEKGRQEGRASGQADLLLRQVTMKFGPQPASVIERLAGASQAELLRWSERVLAADKTDDVFG